MKKLLSLAVAVALAAIITVPAIAQSVLPILEPVNWIRARNGVFTISQTLTELPSGSSLMDTSVAINIDKHLAKSLIALRGSPVTPSLDSLWYFNVVVNGAPAGWDSMGVMVDYTLDGSTWTVLDSLGDGVTTQNSVIPTIAARDTSSFLLTSVTDPNGGTSRSASLTFHCNPWSSLGGMTRRYVQAVRALRLRVRHDYSAATATGPDYSIAISLLYPALSK